MTDADTTQPDAKQMLLDAIVEHVPFDGWSETSFSAAIRQTGIDPAVARGVCPRGAVDLALASHKAGDAEMVKRLRAADLSSMRFREKVAAAIRFRLEAIPNKELVQRGMTLFALPPMAADGARAIWDTADAIWNTLGDGSEDINWYTKRATLSAVYWSTVLYWLGDTSPDHENTWEFLDRRINDVMQFEKLKAQVGGNSLLKPLFAGPSWALSFIKAPTRMPNVDLPGTWNRSP